ncbi:EAL domain-containing protein [Psychromonas hadalis]|uniref:EAL domain-containing protein n=1 Tax=Psychromonas hadalis TaxID=211669 RepID=UPI0003B3577C|nr:EAL domain-containing protein [Psychromonas hadalis]
MSLASFQKRISAPILLLIIFSIISFFVTNIGDPTDKNITNNSDFTLQSSYFITSTDQSFKKIQQGNDIFIPVQIKDIPWSFQQHTYWLKIEIENRRDKEVSLVSHFDNAMLDNLSIFQVDRDGTVFKQSQLGDHQENLALKQRIIPHFNFEISARSDTTLYVRINTTGIASTPIHIYQHNDFIILVQQVHLLWGIFIGVSIIIALYNLVLYFAVKDTVYLIYIGYILFSLTLMGVVLGYGFYLYPDNLQLIFNHQVIALNCLVAIFTLLFLVYFLKFQIEKQWYYKLAMLIITLLSLLFLVSLWLPEYRGAPLLFMLMPFFYLTCFILLFNKMYFGLRWGRIYVYSWIPLLIGSAIQPLVLTGKIEYSFLSHHAFMIGVLMEVVLMAMALADRMRFQREQTIYNATHELSSGLPNSILLERHVTQLLEAKKEFAVCLIEIENYHALVPYMAQQELQKLEFQIIKDISPLLAAQSLIKRISHVQNRDFKIAKAIDGKLAFTFETTDRDFLSLFLNQLQSLIVRELQLNGLLVDLNTKIGICFSVESANKKSASELIQHALLAINQNKESDDHLHYYHDLEVLNIKEHLSLACDLQSAIRENQLHLYHQPQIDLKTGKVYGSEVLLRWNHPDHGFISPELFVGIAEDTGLINELTRWVINCAFQQLQRLHAHHHIDHKVSINISGKDISLPGFLGYVKEKIQQSGIVPNSIIFELTESVMVSDFKALSGLMAALNKLGIKLSIDDYGSGYSSLTYISQLKFDELKIDKAFILDLDRSERNLTIVKTTIDMAKNLNLKVVGEGVESAAIEKKLIESGCDIGQGYYYSKPLSFDKYLLWLDDRSK